MNSTPQLDICLITNQHQGPIERQVAKVLKESNMSLVKVHIIYIYMYMHVCVHVRVRVSAHACVCANKLNKKSIYFQSC